MQIQSPQPANGLHLPEVKPWYSNRWPWFLMVAPLASVIVGSYAAYLAFSRPDALVVDDYYRQGRAINQDLRRDHAAAALGLISRLRYDPAGGQMTGQLQGFNGPVTGKVRLSLVHATLPEKDIILEVQPDQQGQFTASLPLLEKSRWEVQIENGKRDWRLTGAWAWPQQQAISLKADFSPAD
jgi:hypothetical protein